MIGTDRAQGALVAKEGAISLHVSYTLPDAAVVARR